MSEREKPDRDPCSSLRVLSMSAKIWIPYGCWPTRHATPSYPPHWCLRRSAASAVQRADRQFRSRVAEDGIIQEVLGRWLSGADLLRMHTHFEALLSQLRDGHLGLFVTARAGNTPSEPSDPAHRRRIGHHAGQRQRSLP